MSHQKVREIKIEKRLRVDFLIKAILFVEKFPSALSLLMLLLLLLLLMLMLLLLMLLLLLPLLSCLLLYF